MKKSSNDNFTFKLASIIIVVVCIVVLAAIIRLLWLHNAPAQQPVAVSEFIAEYFDPNYVSTEEDNVFEKYFEESEEVEYAFDEVCKMWSPGYTAYTVETVGDGFTIIRLFDVDGVQINPPIGFWYRCDNKITWWRIGRLQPFSRYDSEFSTLWEGLYGWT